MSEKEQEIHSIERLTNTSLEEFKFMVENSNDLISVTDDKLNRVYINAKDRIVLGYPIDEYLKKPIKTYFHPDDLERANKDLKLLMEKGALTGEYRLLHKDGHVVWFEISGKKFTINDSEDRIVFIIRDITEKKELESKLKASEGMHRLISERTSDLILLMDEKWNVIYNNDKTTYKTLGYDPGELSRPIAELIHEEDIGTAIDSLYMITKQKDLTIVKEIRLKHKSGFYLWFEIKASSYNNENGETRILVIGRDITGRKNIQLQLQESESRYRFITENIYDPIVIINEDFKIEYINEVGTAPFGWREIDLIGKEALKFIHPDDVEKAAKILNLGLITGSGQADIRIRDAHGIYRVFNARGRAFVESGKKKAIIVYRDITARKEAEENLRRSEGRFRMITEHSNDLILVLDKNARLSYFNKRGFSEMLGYERANYYNEKILGLVHKDDYKDAENLISTLLQSNNGSIEQNLRFKHQDGHYIHLNIRGTSYLDNAGLKKILLVGRDITKEIQAMNRLSESEMLHRLIAENASEIILLIDEYTKEIYLNKKALHDILGYNRDDFKVEHFGLLIHPDDFELAIDALIDLQREIGIKNTAEIRFKHADDAHYVWLEIEGKSFLNEEGKKRILLIGRDVSRRKEAELKLRESEEMYRVISDNANDLIVVTDQNFVSYYVNNPAMLGYDRDYFDGRSLIDLVHEDDIPSALNVFVEGFVIGSGVGVYRVRHKDGHYMTFEFKGNTYIDKDGMKKAILIGRDKSSENQE